MNLLTTHHEPTLIMNLLTTHHEPTLVMNLLTTHHEPTLITNLGLTLALTLILCFTVPMALRPTIRLIPSLTEALTSPCTLRDSVLDPSRSPCPSIHLEVTPNLTALPAESGSPSLFAFSPECNFSGRKYPMALAKARHFT